MHHIFRLNTWINALFILLLLIAKTGSVFADTVKNGAAGYQSFTEAYAAAQTGNTLKMRGIFFDEGMYLDKNISIIVNGGFDPTFSSNSGGTTTIKGPLIIGPGSSVILDKIVIAGIQSANSITQYGITWTFDRAYHIGQFANGDYWVVGPVTIISITNNYHVHGFTPVQGQDGSQINPGTNDKQGYDNSLSSYQANLNVSYPNGQTISTGNPLVLGTNQTLISAVSWLYSSESNTEPGCPSFNGGTHTPRPVLRAASVLTCLVAAPPVGSFRPPYVGGDKTIRFNISQLQPNLLSNLSTSGISSIPDVETMENNFQRAWIDHVNEYMGSYVHPSENIPVSLGYGQEMTLLIGDTTLLLNLDFSELPGSPSKETLLIELVQLGIDLAGIADNNGYWPPNGGHNMGRKAPILFAGLILNDTHMKNVGNWTTLFQEDANTFFVSQDDIDRTHSAQWSYDSRDAGIPYETQDIGLPEYGIRHATGPYKDNWYWDAQYRAINASSYPGFLLVAHIMGQKAAWNHNALFDFTDRWMEITGGEQQQQKVTPFTMSMWNAYRANYPPVWQVPAPILPDISLFKALPATITAGQSSTLSWNVSGATAISIDNGIGTVTNSGSLVLSPTITTSYKMTATNGDGHRTATFTVTVR